MKNKSFLAVLFFLLVLLGVYFGYSAYRLATVRWLAGPVAMMHEKEWKGTMMSIAEYEQFLQETIRPMEDLFAHQGFSAGASEKKLKAAKQKRDNQWLLCFLFSFVGIGGLLALWLNRPASATSYSENETA